MAFVLENLLRFELELYLEFSLNIQLQQMNLGWKDFQALQNTQGGGGGRHYDMALSWLPRAQALVKQDEIQRALALDMHYSLSKLSRASPKSKMISG